MNADTGSMLSFIVGSIIGYPIGLGIALLIFWFRDRWMKRHGK